MSFRTKLLLTVLLIILSSVSVVSYGVTYYTKAGFEDRDARRTEALVSQFKKEFAQRGDQVAQQVKNVVDSTTTLRMALDLARPNADQSTYFNDAKGAAQEHSLDFVQFINSDGTIVSSYQYPARVGYKEEWVLSRKDWEGSGAFLKREEVTDHAELSLTVVRTLSGGNDRTLYVVGGRRLDEEFLSSLVLPSGMRALLYRNFDQWFST